ncbi:unnamed protein product [Blumeria hordei]|uniref:Uncharacterized protein n=1 Tax=Blumeria hordei TaxID=2867405 RepID=A0A383V0B9_BLUHO|nr:unnamed protein product [Blumeria hordei]
MSHPNSSHVSPSASPPSPSAVANRRRSRFQEGSENTGDPSLTTDTYLRIVLSEMDDYERKRGQSDRPKSFKPITNNVSVESFCTNVTDLSAAARASRANSPIMGRRQVSFGSVQHPGPSGHASSSRELQQAWHGVVKGFKQRFRALTTGARDKKFSPAYAEART